jgi:hypothetical protein
MRINDIRAVGEILDGENEIRSIQLISSSHNNAYVKIPLIHMLLLVLIDSDCRLRFNLVDDDVNEIELKVIGWTGPSGMLLDTYLPIPATQDKRITLPDYRVTSLHTYDYECSGHGPFRGLKIGCRSGLGIQLEYPNPEDAAHLLIHGIGPRHNWNRAYGWKAQERA